MPSVGESVLIHRLCDNLSDVGGCVDARMVSEARMPTVIREMTPAETARTSNVDESQLDTDQSFADDFNPALQTVDGNTMLGAVNRIADVSTLTSFH